MPEPSIAAFAGKACLQQPVAAAGAVFVEAGIGWDVRMRCAGADSRRHAFHRRALVQRVAERHHRRLVAAAHARRAHDADALAG